jgi:hypothetical protein
MEYEVIWNNTSHSNIIILYMILLNSIFIGGESQVCIGLWCLAPLSTIFQLYRGGQCYWWSLPEKTTDLLQVTNKLYNIMLCRVHVAWAGFNLTTSVVICTDCIGNCKSNYHKTTTTWVFRRIHWQTVSTTLVGIRLTMSAVISTYCSVNPTTIRLQPHLVWNIDFI